jgi:hypothetical protein
MRDHSIERLRDAPDLVATGESHLTVQVPARDVVGGCGKSHE